MRSPRILSAALLLLTAPLLAGPPPRGPHPLLTSFSEADIVVVATLTAFTPDTQPANAPRIDPNTREGNIAMHAFRPAGTYTFSINYTLSNDKLPPGQTELQLHLPLFSSYEYQSPFDLPLGIPVMLLLQKDDLNRWVPVDFHRPLIPLSSDALKKNSEQSNVHSTNLILDSLPDDKIRSVLLHILRDVKLPQLADSIAPYTDDKNLATLSLDELLGRCDALRCLAVNQDLSAIDKLPAFAIECQKRRTSSGPLDLLGAYTDRRALPLMIPLLASDVEYMPINARGAIYALADESTIPVLIAALDNDDPEHLTAAGILSALHHIVPALPSNADIPQIKAWWSQQPHYPHTSAR